MSKKRKGTMDFRFYEIPQGESALVLCGEPWKRIYGHEDVNLHFHNLMEIGICRYGAGTMYLDDKSYRYSDGTITIIPESFPHNTVSDGECANFWEYIFCNPKALLEEMFPDNAVYRNDILRTINRQSVIGMMSEYQPFVNLFNSIIKETSEQRPMYRQQINFLMKAIMTEIIRNVDNPELPADTKKYGGNMPRISKALEFISENYQKNISTENIASACGLSETHFRRMFVEYINMTPMDYVTLCRIQNACELMKHSDDPMDIVAAKCGFTTTSTFNRNFKKFLDTSPYKWKINPENYEYKLLNYKISALKGWD